MQRINVIKGINVMARHAEVKEKEIIEAALAIEQKGKIPNPGAIRAKLGFRGGLARIGRVWEAFQEKRNGTSDNECHLTIEDLPTEISDAYNYLLENQKNTLESIIVQSYQRCQALFEKRLDDYMNQHSQFIKYYREYEESADESIDRLEKELNSLNMEIKGLADQNAKLILENAELKGSVKAFEQRLPPTKTQRNLENNTDN